jgi:hypothetical protein
MLSKQKISYEKSLKVFRKKSNKMNLRIWDS